ncbi:MAG: hypothetical protein CMJ80_02350 [Planctomycetaceae bacterium]|nr:hypothetical protein [Planctomycetaceae bacterium]
MESSLRITSLMEALSLKLSNQNAVFDLQTWRGGILPLSSHRTHFGYVARGHGALTVGNTAYPLISGSYFSVPGEATLVGDLVLGVVVSQHDYHGLFQVGGPIEERGRLRYIDGCSDTLLISPVLKGDACFNLLCLPMGVNQTPHTHPSFRVGVVVSGEGECRLEDGKSLLMCEHTLFVLPPNCLHSFHTPSAAMRVVAFHPDSDFGPTHQNHPMINRTIVEGVSAAKLPTDTASLTRKGFSLP